MPKSNKIGKKKTGKVALWYEVGSANIFKDLGHSDEEAANLMLRSELMLEIASVIQKRGLQQAEVAKILGVKQPRISELITGRIAKFKVDVLIKYLKRLGIKVGLILEDQHKVA